MIKFEYFRGDAQAKTGKVKDTKGNFKKKLVELRKKIKQTTQDANSCDDGRSFKVYTKPSDA